MKKTTTYLDEAKKALGIESDNAMAIYLGVTRQAISNYRHATKIMDDFCAAKIAGALGINEMIVIAAANAEREKTEDRKEFWRNFYERLGGVAASIYLCVTLGFVTLIVSPTPAEAATARQGIDYTVYYVKLTYLWNRLKTAALAACRLGTFAVPVHSLG